MQSMVATARMRAIWAGHQKKWEIIFLAGCLLIWKERNRRIFSGGSAATPKGLSVKIVGEVALWEKYLLE
jgi:hypothetical protein